ADEARPHPDAEALSRGDDLGALAQAGGAAERKELHPGPGEPHDLGEDPGPCVADRRDLSDPGARQARLEQEAPDQLHPAGHPEGLPRPPRAAARRLAHTASPSPSGPRNEASIVESRPSTWPQLETATHPASSMVASSATSTFPDRMSSESAA